MKLTHIRDLVTISERGGLRRAARHLGVAAPAITRSIRELEHELGASLFERNGTGMVLTPIGEAFSRRSAAIQLEIKRACEEVQQMRGIGSGTVSIGLSTASHLALLPAVLKPFQRRYPDVLLNIREGLFPTIEPGLRGGLVDFYVGPLSEEGLSGGLTSETLFENCRIVIARRGHPLAQARSLKELVDAQWVATSVTTLSEAELNPVFEEHGLPMPEVAVLAHSAATMITVAASSDLLAMLPQQWLAFVHSSGLLHKIELREQLTAPAIRIIARSTLPLTPAAEYLADLFRPRRLNRADPKKAPVTLFA